VLGWRQDLESKRDSRRGLVREKNAGREVPLHVLILIVWICNVWNAWSVCLGHAWILFAFLDFSRNRLAAHELPPGDTCCRTQFLGLSMNRMVMWRYPPGDVNWFLQFIAFLILLCCWCCLDEPLRYTRVYFDVIG